MSTAAQLSLLEGRAARDAGLDQAERNARGWVQRARDAAVRIFREKGEAHIDDVRDWANDAGDLPASSRAWGAVFRRTPETPWKAIGVRASRVKSNHAHASPIWVLEAVDAR